MKLSEKLFTLAKGLFFMAVFFIGMDTFAELAEERFLEGEVYKGVAYVWMLAASVLACVATAIKVKENIDQ